MPSSQTLNRIVNKDKIKIIFYGKLDLRSGSDRIFCYSFLYFAFMKSKMQLLCIMQHIMNQIIHFDFLASNMKRLQDEKQKDRQFLNNDFS